MNTIRLPGQRGGAAVLQQRHFHQSRPRKLVTGLTIVGILVVFSIGAVYIYGAVQIIEGESIPPHIWARTVDQQTCDEVETALAARFEKARRSAPDKQNDALREATFQVPHELARLNKDAPDFRLEFLGPMVYGKKFWDKLGEARPSHAPFIDIAEEARVFLYFPNSAAKATAVFVAINHELGFPMKGPQWSAQGKTMRLERAIHAIVETALFLNVSRFEVRARSHPLVTDRMTDRIEEMERLPIIFNFREKAFGALYHTRTGKIRPIMAVKPVTMTRLDGGIL